jgi:hypothetical protein
MMKETLSSMEPHKSSQALLRENISLPSHKARLNSISTTPLKLLVLETGSETEEDLLGKIKNQIRQLSGWTMPHRLWGSLLLWTQRNKKRRLFLMTCTIQPR